MICNGPISCECVYRVLENLFFVIYILPCNLVDTVPPLINFLTVKVADVIRAFLYISNEQTPI